MLIYMFKKNGLYYSLNCYVDPAQIWKFEIVVDEMDPSTDKDDGKELKEDI